MFRSSQSRAATLYFLIFHLFKHCTSSSANLNHILVVAVEPAITQPAITVPQARTAIIAPVNEDTLLSHPDDDENMLDY
jgi:hypothetical protein